jgi:hypothetical protein
MKGSHFVEVFEEELGLAVALKVVSKSVAMLMISSNEGVSPKNIGLVRMGASNRRSSGLMTFPGSQHGGLLDDAA